jgi:hypothetical protein
MKRIPVVLLAMVLALVLVGSYVFAGERQGKDEVKSNILYVCNCGPECKCNTVSTKPGKCGCGVELVPMRILRIEGDEAVLCTCGKGCMCKSDPNDPAKCGCGKPVKRVSLKGLYVCACGAGCDCNTVSDKPGKCRCNKDLRKVE